MKGRQKTPRPVCCLPFIPHPSPFIPPKKIRAGWLFRVSRRPWERVALTGAGAGPARGRSRTVGGVSADAKPPPEDRLFVRRRSLDGDGRGNAPRVPTGRRARRENGAKRPDLLGIPGCEKF